MFSSSRLTSWMKHNAFIFIIPHLLRVILILSFILDVSEFNTMLHVFSIPYHIFFSHFVVGLFNIKM